MTVMMSDVRTNNYSEDFQPFKHWDASVQACLYNFYLLIETCIIIISMFTVESEIRNEMRKR